MKKYFLIWLVTGILSEVLLYSSSMTEDVAQRGYWSDLAVFLNPYAMLYMGHDLYSKAFWNIFLFMHTLRLVWLLIAGWLDRKSCKFFFTKYIAWIMLVLYLTPSLFVL